MIQSDLQKIVDKQLKYRQIHNVVVGVQSAEGRLEAAAGTAYSDVPMTVDTPYFIASVSKMYTAAVILNFHELGVLSLDDPISEYLPLPVYDQLHVYNGTDYSSQIKVYQLLNQTSGLPDYFEDKPPNGMSVREQVQAGNDRALTRGEVLDLVRSLPPTFAPGTRARYTDTNYHLLGAIIEYLTGKLVAEVFQEKIFDPLGLGCTYAYGYPGETPCKQPAAFYLKDQAFTHSEFLTTHTAEGGLVSTAADSLTFLKAFFDGRLFDPLLFERITEHWNRIFFPMQYGYGLMRFKLPRIFTMMQPIPDLIGHSGSTGSFAYYVPVRKICVAGTFNQFATPRRPFQLMIQILKAMN